MRIRRVYEANGDCTLVTVPVPLVIGEDPAPRKFIASFPPSLCGSKRMSKYYVTLQGIVNWYNLNPCVRIQTLASILKKRGVAKKVRPKSKQASQVNCVSLRKLDEYVRHGITDVDVIHDYKDQIINYKRVMFDPFCRSQKLSLEIVTDDSDTADESVVVLRTCVAQLNFISWAIEIGILDQQGQLLKRF